MSQITSSSTLSESKNSSSNAVLAGKVDESSTISTYEYRSAEATKLSTPVVEVEEEPEEQNNENQSNKASRKNILPVAPKVVSLAELIHQCSPLSDGSDENQNEMPKASTKVSLPVRPDGRTGIHSSQINDWIKEIVANFYNRFVASKKQLNQSLEINESVHEEEVVEQSPFLLPPIPKNQKLQKKCLVLDLDETLIHSFASYTPLADFVMRIELDEGVFHPIYVVKRPGVEEFLKKCSEHFEIVVFTASLSKYANPLLDYLDPTHTLIKHRLFREHCVHNYGSYVKDLSLLGRPLSQTIIVDNSPHAYTFHYRNAIPCSSFFDNTNDMELYDILNFLNEVHDVDDARSHLGRWRDKMNRY